MDFTSTGAMRSPFSPRVRQPITGRRAVGMSSTKKNQNTYNQAAEEQGGDVIYKTPLITLETYGAPLPVMVTEALTFGSGSVSVRLSACGWCWLVAGRRALAWPTAGDAPARELTLPQTDLAHKADLVMLFYQDDAQMPSCVGVSPEGIVRYWASVGQEGAYVDVSCELAGQECERLVGTPLVLATTTCTLVRITPTAIDGRATVSCRTLRPPSGWLGGIGRRVSLMFFGSMPAHVDTMVGVDLSQSKTTSNITHIALILGGTLSCVVDITRKPWYYQSQTLNKSLLQIMQTSIPQCESYPLCKPCEAGNSLHPVTDNVALHHIFQQKLVGVVVLGDGGSEGAAGCIALVAGGGGGPLLQLWRGDELHEHSLRRALLDAHARPPLAPHGEASGVELMPLEVRGDGDAGLLLLLLLAAGSAPRDPDLRYSIAHISLEEVSAPRVTSVRAVRWPAAREPPPRFLLLGQHALLYTAHCIALATSGAGEASACCDVGAAGDRVLAAELCPAPLLFCSRHGVLRLQHAPAPSGAWFGAAARAGAGAGAGAGRVLPTAADSSLALHEIDPHEISAVATDACGKLKTAFLFHLRREQQPCRLLLQQLFPTAADLGDDVDNALDRTVLAVLIDTLDDMPAGDPRWRAACGGAARVPLGSSAALTAAAQLADKRRVLDLLLDFLRAAHLYPRLRSLTHDGVVVRTEVVLRWLAEQLAAATALRALQHGADAHLIDAAIHQVVCGADGEEEEEEEVSRALSSGALSASDVSYRRVTRTWRVLRALCARRAPHAHRAHHHAALCALVHTVLSEMEACRAQWPASASPVLLPAERALLAALLDLLQSAVTSAEGAEAGARSAVLEGAARLAAAVLAAAAPLQHAPHTAALHRDMCTRAIQPFVEAGQTERAAALAERAADLPLLARLYADDPPRLFACIDKYLDQGMCEVALSWLGETRRVRLLLAVGAQHEARLAAWLAAGGAARGPLAALHALHAARPLLAAQALADLADEETASVHRMTTMASLAKLCLVSAGPSGDAPCAVRRKVESRVSLGAHHAALPRALRDRYALADEPAVRDPADLVQMYVEGGDGSLTEYDYKKALELTELVHEPELAARLRLQVWCACIRRQEWAACEGEGEGEGQAPRDTMFSRLLELVHVMGGEVATLLPPLEQLLAARELADLPQAALHYQLRCTLHHMQHVQPA